MNFKDTTFNRGVINPGPMYGNFLVHEPYGPINRRDLDTVGSTNELNPKDIQNYSYWHEKFCICALCKATPNSNGDWRRGEPVYTYTVKERCLDVGVIEASEKNALDLFESIIRGVDSSRSKPPLVVGSFHVSSLSETWDFAIESGTYPTQQKIPFDQLMSDLFSGKRHLPLKQLVTIKKMNGQSSFWIITISNSGNWFLI